jgi:hypothetical protein
MAHPFGNSISVLVRLLRFEQRSVRIFQQRLDILAIAGIKTDPRTCRQPDLAAVDTIRL